jgi:hypothetical protein
VRVEKSGTAHGQETDAAYDEGADEKIRAIASGTWSQRRANGVHDGIGTVADRGFGIDLSVSANDLLSLPGTDSTPDQIAPKYRTQWSGFSSPWVQLGMQFDTRLQNSL